MNRVARGASLIVATLVSLAAFSSAARAVVSLNWNSCVTPVGTPLQTFACDTNVGTPFDLIVGMSPFALMSDVRFVFARIWISADDPTLPSWWQVQPGGCRAAEFTLAPDPPFPTSCADPWFGRATLRVDFPQNCDPRGTNLTLTATVPDGVPLTLSPGFHYAMFRLRFSKGHTSGADACVGCAIGACIWTDGIGISTASGAFTDSGRSTARWQFNGGCQNLGLCPPVSTSRPTWGAIKSFYR